MFLSEENIMGKNVCVDNEAYSTSLQYWRDWWTESHYGSGSWEDTLLVGRTRISIILVHRNNLEMCTVLWSILSFILKAA
jgi:hypothetical protein